MSTRPELERLRTASSVLEGAPPLPAPVPGTLAAALPRREGLVSLPTGTGKTLIFAQFPHYFRMKKRLLVLAHGEELLEQARQKFHAADPSLPV